jgi:uncharacterized membrane protein
LFLGLVLRLCGLFCCSGNWDAIGDGQMMTLVLELFFPCIGVLETSWWPTVWSSLTCTIFVLMNIQNLFQNVQVCSH